MWNYTELCFCVGIYCTSMYGTSVYIYVVSGFVAWVFFFFFFQAEDGIRDVAVTGVQTCALPILVPMAGGSLITKIKKAFDELITLGLVDAKPVRFFGAQATGCSPISTAVKAGNAEIDPQKPATIARSLAIGNPADGHYAIKTIKANGGWAEDISDPEIVESIQLLAETEGIFTETAGGVTVGCARKLYRQDRILPDETTVLCITGNGLKTTDVLNGKYEAEEPIPPKIAEFDKYLERTLDIDVPEAVEA